MKKKSIAKKQSKTKRKENISFLKISAKLFFAYETVYSTGNNAVLSVYNGSRYNNKYSAYHM